MKPPAILSDHRVSMSNALSRAGTTLSLIEKRLVAACVAQLDSRRKLPTPGTSLMTELRAEDYATTYEVDISTAYHELRQAAAHLYRRSITFYEPAGLRGARRRDPVMVTMRWISAAKYHTGAGRVELHWTPMLLPHLLELKREFTSYRLRQASALRSIYAWRLLEIVESYKHRQLFEIEIEQLKNMLEAPPSCRNDFAQFRRWVLEPAIRDLQKHSPWEGECMEIRYNPVKYGRKVIAIEFHFEYIEQPHLPGLDPDNAPKFRPFPKNGSIRYDKHWYGVYKDSGCIKDSNLVGTEFVEFCQERNISLSNSNIEKTFQTFATKNKVSGQSPSSVSARKAPRPRKTPSAARLSPARKEAWERIRQRFKIHCGEAIWSSWGQRLALQDRGSEGVTLLGVNANIRDRVELDYGDYLRAEWDAEEPGIKVNFAVDLR